MCIRFVVVFIILLGLWGVSTTSFAQACPDLPEPRLIIGQRGQVTPGNANNLRDVPSTSGGRLGQIPGGGVFEVLEGPVCAEGFNWWKVSFAGVEAWTVEGNDGDYWLEPIAPTPTPAPTATPMPTATPQPARAFVPPLAHINVLQAGVRARVISDNPADDNIRLSLRQSPSTSAEILTSLQQDDIVTILGEAVDADSLFWREVETSDGRRGWVVEALPNNNRLERTLVAECPVQAGEGRLSFRLGDYVYSLNTQGERVCIHDFIEMSGWHTTYLSSFAYVPNRFEWSPDGTQFAYVDYAPNSINQDLFIVSADGLTRRQITQDSDVVWFDWSPNGQRLLFARTLGGQINAQIWTMNADGSRLAALTRDGGRKLWGAWLDDNESVVYAEVVGELPSQMGRTYETDSTLYRINVDKGGLTKLFEGKHYDMDFASISPDRGALLFGGFPLEPIAGTQWAEPAAPTNRMIAPQTNETLAESLDDLGRWLPDSSGFFSLDAGKLYIQRFGEDEQVIPMNPALSDDYFGLYSMGYLADGRWAFFTVYFDKGEVYALDLSTGELSQLYSAQH